MTRQLCVVIEVIKVKKAEVGLALAPDQDRSEAKTSRSSYTMPQLYPVFLEFSPRDNPGTVESFQEELNGT
jgi:hypothetical protein